MSNKILISGHGPSNFGVGRLIRHIDQQPFIRSKYFKWVGYDEFKSARKNRDYIHLIIQGTKTVFFLLRFLVVVMTISGKELVIVHPQTVGWGAFKRLIRRNKIHWYLMDNSFFCIKSYNFRSEEGECTDCLSSLSNCHDSCQPVASPIKKPQLLKTLSFIKDNYQSISFYAQNHSQMTLAKRFFGDDINCEVIGLNTGEIKVDEKRNLKTDLPKKGRKAQLVYHAGLSEVKGIKYFIELALATPDYEFVLPYQKEQVESLLDRNLSFDHIVFNPCTWETGLKELVEGCHITFCPSLWSSCIEGAVLKSLYFSKRVAMVENNYGFVNDLPDDLILKLASSPKDAVEQIQKDVEPSIDFRDKAEIWLTEFLKNSQNNLHSLFSEKV